MPREIVIIECTEARKEGKSPSRYMTTRNFRKQGGEKVEKMKSYAPCDWSDGSGFGNSLLRHPG